MQASGLIEDSSKESPQTSSSKPCWDVHKYHAKVFGLVETGHDSRIMHSTATEAERPVLTRRLSAHRMFKLVVCLKGLSGKGLTLLLSKF